MRNESSSSESCWPSALEREKAEGTVTQRNDEIEKTLEEMKATVGGVDGRVVG